MSEKTYVAVQKRGLISLPADVRRRNHLDQPGAQVEVTERDGVIELRPTVAVPADQQWFWTERWQAMEREADADAGAGRIARSDDVDGFLAELDAE